MEFINKYGEQFSRKVTHVHKTNDTIIWIRLDGTMQSMQIDIENRAHILQVQGLDEIGKNVTTVANIYAPTGFASRLVETFVF